MKIKKLAIIILMTTFFIILGTTVYATTGEINSKEVKLRKKPDSSSTILDIIYEGDEVEILEQEEGWYKIKVETSLGKVTGYVSQDVVDIEADTQDDTEQPVDVENNDNIENSVEETESNEVDNMDSDQTISTSTSNEIEESNKYTLTQEVSIKALPLINSRDKAKISGTIEIIETINDWSRIESDTEIGWIRTVLLTNVITKVEAPTQEETQETPQEENAPEEEVVPEETTTEPEKNEENEATPINKIGYVSADGLRVRKGPSTETEEINSLSKNDEVEIIGQTGKWYKINIDGKVGYVSAKYISDTKVYETTTRSGSTLNTEPETKTETTIEQKQEDKLVTENIPVVEETPSISEIPEATEPSTISTTGAAIVEYAKQYLGCKYVSGGTSPSKGFDCSGFTQYVYKHFGISLYRTSRDQIKNGVAVEKSNLQLGDIVIFNNDANTAIGHVGIYVGDGNFIHASNPSDGVKITSLSTSYYKIRYVGARRVI